jgi:hypothetical protein
MVLRAPIMFLDKLKYFPYPTVSYHGLIVLCVLFAISISPSIAGAFDSAYCDKVRARANGEAALLLGPRLFAQGLRFPFSMDMGPVVADNFQMRVGLSYSPLDAYRGLRLMDVSDADCDAHESWSRINRLLRHAQDIPPLSAYRAQTAFLDGLRGQWQALLEIARQRLKAKLITVVEFGAFWRLTETLERKGEEARGAAARLEAHGVRPSRDPIDALAKTYLQSQNELEKRISGLKSLDAWSFKVVGGGIPSPDRSLGWFGWAEISYSLGGLFRDHQESNYLKARSAELLSADYEYQSGLLELKKQIDVQIIQARRELAIVERHLSFLVDMRTTLERVDTPNTAHERDSLFVEQLSAESDRVFLHALIEGLVTLVRREEG